MHQAVIIIAKYFILLSILLTIWVFVEQPRAKKKEFILIAVGGAILSLLVAKVGSHFYYDPRPFVVGHFTPYFSHGADNGFPSDHTLFASFMTFVAFRYSKKFGVALLLLAVLIGLSRVQAGVHHLVDIIGAFACSAIGVGIAMLLVKKFASSKPTYTAPAHRQ